MSQTSPSLPFLQFFCGRIGFKNLNKSKICTEGKSDVESEKRPTVFDKWSLHYSKIFEMQWQTT